LNQELQLMPKFQAAYLALQKAKSVNEVKRVRDQAEAIRLYVRQRHMGPEMQNSAAEIKLRAERKAGRMLGTKDWHGGDRKSKSQAPGETMRDPWRPYGGLATLNTVGMVEKLSAEIL